MRNIKIGSVEGKPGTISKGYIKIGELNSGAPINIPIIIVTGLEDGPKLLVTSGIHGEEVEGMTAAARITKEISPQKLKGTLITAPILNVPALVYLNRLNIQESPSPCEVSGVAISNGRISERIAYLLQNEIAKNAEYVLDLHATHWDSVNYPRTFFFQSSDEYVNKKIEDMAFAAGMEIMQKTGLPRPNTFTGAMVSKGIPIIGLETGEGWRLKKPHTEILIRGIKNVMKHLGMLNGEPELPQMQVVITKRHEVHVNKGGIMHGKLKPGDYVSKGDLVAVVRDPFDDVVEELKSPADGIAVRVSLLPIVSTGSRACCIYETDLASKWRGRKVPALEKQIG